MANEPSIYHLLAAGSIAIIKHTLWIIVVVQVLRSGISQGDKIKVYTIKSETRDVCNSFVERFIKQC